MPTASGNESLPENAIAPATQAAWRKWLIANHTQPKGVWLVMWKQASGRAKFGYDEAVFEALCVGWVDSKPRKLDEDRSMLWFAPRKPNTGWSRKNKERIAKAIELGKMHSAGLAKIEAAKRDGSWTKLDEIEDGVIPDDLIAMFAKYRRSKENFEAFPRSVRRGILEWISTAKRPETRLARITETAMLAARNERANQWRKQ